MDFTPLGGKAASISSCEVEDDGPETDQNYSKELCILQRVIINQSAPPSPTLGSVSSVSYTSDTLNLEYEKMLKGKDVTIDQLRWELKQARFAYKQQLAEYNNLKSKLQVLSHARELSEEVRKALLEENAGLVRRAGALHELVDSLEKEKVEPETETLIPIIASW